MPYSDFSLELVVERFGLDIKAAPLFTPQERSPINPPQWLEPTLTRGATVDLTGDKARAEFIIAPIFLAVRELSHEAAYLYSGRRFDVTPIDVLSGVCDFIMTLAGPSPLITDPLICITNAKRGELEEDYGRCAAQMVVAQRFNQNALPSRHAPAVVYGCATTGRVWQFIRLHNNVLTFDTPLLFLGETEKILAAFLAMLK